MMSPMASRAARMTTRGVVVLSLLGGLASAPATGQASQAAPMYAVISLEIDVNRPASDVWKRVGKYCDIGEWLKVPCRISAGADGEIGAVRTVGDVVLVGRTELSYTYAAPVRAGRPSDFLHGTLEARPVTASTSKLLYTLLYDNSTLADDAARAADRARRITLFTGALKNMKVLAEGGRLP